MNAARSMSSPSVLSAATAAAARLHVAKQESTRLAAATQSRRWFGSGGGTRGARGHGWWVNYRAGKGGRHLQGEYYHLDVEKMKAWNDSVFALGSQHAYMDIVLEPMVKKAASSSDSSSTAADGAAPADDVTVHRLNIELASEVFPKAVANFVKLMEADDDGYKGSILHRIERNVGLVGGHVWKDTGKCAEEFRMQSSLVSMEQTEKLVLSHVPGVLTMLCQRVKEIDSRFVLCTEHAPHMDGMAVAIGRMDEQSISTVAGWQKDLITQNGRPSTVNVKIVDCGLLVDGSQGATVEEDEAA